MKSTNLLPPSPTEDKTKTNNNKTHHPYHLPWLGVRNLVISGFRRNIPSSLSSSFSVRLCYLVYRATGTEVIRNSLSVTAAEVQSWPRIHVGHVHHTDFSSRLIESHGAYVCSANEISPDARVNEGCTADAASRFPLAFLSRQMCGWTRMSKLIWLPPPPPPPPSLLAAVSRLMVHFATVCSFCCWHRPHGLQSLSQIN